MADPPRKGYIAPMKIWLKRIGVLVIIYVLFRGGYVWHRERQIKTLKIGMPLTEVQELLGEKGEPDVSSGGEKPKCDVIAKQLNFTGNAAPLFNGRFEDSIVIYVDPTGKVCDLKRTGL